MPVARARDHVRHAPAPQKRTHARLLTQHTRTRTLVAQHARVHARLRAQAMHFAVWHFVVLHFDVVHFVVLHVTDVRLRTKTLVAFR